MGVSESVTIFTCDCCGYQTTTLDGAYEALVFAGNPALYLCMEHGCADGFRTDVQAWLTQTVSLHQSAVAAGVIPKHPKSKKDIAV